MKILITGGAGFVGSNLAKYFVDKKYDVTIFDNFQRGNGNLKLLKDCNIKKGKLDDLPDLLSCSNFDLIYHFAAQVAVTSSYKDPQKDFNVNAKGTFSLLNAAGKTPVIYASTNKVYGDNVNHIPVIEYPKRYDFKGDINCKGISEDFPVDSRKHTPYGCSKLVGDIYTREFGGVVNRFSCMYGTNQFGNEDQGWVAHFVISKLLHNQLTVYGNGKQVRDLLFIDDVVNLLKIEAENIDAIRGEAFNIGGGYANTASVLELCQRLEITPTFADWRPADQKVYYSDIKKVERILGWQPKVCIEEGLKKLSSWAEENKIILENYHH